MKKLAFFSLSALLLAAPVQASDDGWDDWGEGGEAWETDNGGDGDAANADKLQGCSGFAHCREHNADSLPSSPWTLRGFTELAGGGFTRSNVTPKQSSLAESRSQLAASRYFGDHFFSAKLELVGDGVDEAGRLEARELYLDLDISPSFALRLGQQVLTWGTGDFVFVNDFFAKDWQAMFSGREDDYLKASAAALKATVYGAAANLDIVWTPVLAEDEYINGERFSYYKPSYYNPGAGQIVAAPLRVRAAKPARTLENSQLALRLSKTHHGVEYAAYAYYGPNPQPLGFDPALGRNTFPQTRSLGASVRAPAASGIANMELAWWQGEDSKGSKPLLPNDQLNILFGYERELVSNLTMGTQWLAQQLQDYGAARRALGGAATQGDEWHHTLTLRLTHLALQQKLTTSLFSFYSPDAEDYYIKPKISYRHNDHWQWILGGNLFGGKDRFTQWGQFVDNSNVYARIRYTF